MSIEKIQQLKQLFKKETGYDIGKIHDTGFIYYGEDYVEWLQEKILNFTNEVYEALYCDGPEDSFSPISIHRTEKGARQALADFVRKEKKEWDKLFKDEPNMVWSEFRDVKVLKTKIKE